MLCANCGTSNRDDEKFCRGCLQPLTGAPSASGSAFAPPKATLQDSADYAEFGGFFQRAAAVLIDGFILGLILIPLLGVAAFLGSPGLMLLLMFVAFIGGSAYYVLMESGERGATYGKRAMHLRVVDLNGEQISIGRALGRYLGHVLTNIVPLYLGYLMQPFTERKQALHDMVSGTIVVRTDNEGGSSAGAIIIVGLFFFMVAGVGIAAAVAIPAYQDYVVKASKMAQAMQTGNTASKAVETFYAQAGRYPESMAETGAPLQKPAFISDIEVNPGTGEVQVTFGDREPRSVAGKSISFKPTRYTDGSFVWACSSSEISPKLLPKDCK